MDERAMQFRVGVLVVATVIIMVILIVLFGDFPKSFQGTKTVYVRFNSAPGVTVNTPVRKSGILVGRVEDVRLEEDGRVLVITRLENVHRIREDEICRISTGNFLGDAMLEFIPAEADGLSREPLKNGALLNGVVSKDAISAMTNALQVFDTLAVDLKATLSTIQTASSDIGQVAKNMNTLVINNQGQFNRILGKAEQALTRFDTAMVSVNQVVTDQDLAKKLSAALDSIPKLLTDAEGLIKGLNSVAAEAETNLKFLQGLTKPLSESGGQIVSNLDQSLMRLDTVLQELQVFTKALNSEEGSLGQFIHNPDLYHRLTSAATNIEEITYQLQPIVYNVNVISDKLARNPGRILRGAIGRQQSGMK